MKKSVWVVLAAALVSTGCDTVCEISQQITQNSSVPKVQVHAALSDPSLVPIVCKDFKEGWHDVISTAASKLGTATHDELYWEDRVCEHETYRQVCGWVWGPGPIPGGHPGYPNGRDRYWDCQWIRQCDQVRTIPHYRRGYEDAVAVKTALLKIDDALVRGCTAQKNGDSYAVHAHFSDARVQFDDLEKYNDQLCTRLSCDKRQGH